MDPLAVLPLLQSDFDRSAQSLSGGAIIAIVIVALVIVGLVIYNSVKNRAERFGTAYAPPVAKAAVKAPSFHASAFRRAGQEMGLTGEQVSFLESYARKLSLSNPDYVIRNPEAMEAFLRSIFQDIETKSDSQPVAEQRTAVLFQIRERIELSRAAGKQVSSTKSLKSGTVLTCITADGEHYTSRIEAMSPEGMACAVPLDGLGQELHFRRGTRFTAFFYSSNQSGHSFETKVDGYARFRDGTAMILRHSDRVKPLPVREHKRKSTNKPCEFIPVTIVVVKQGGRTGKKAVLGQRAFPGQITDISAGGCSIRTANPLDESEYLKIDFAGKSGRLSAIGKVVKLERIHGQGGDMHIQFAKISRQDLNKVLSMVYGYGE